MSLHPDLVIPSGGDWVNPGMDYKAFRDAGHSFAMRYAVPSITGKMITAGEVQHAHSSGIDIGLTYETSGTTWRGGADAGQHDGITARFALQDLGAPHSVCCYHAVDAQVQPADMWMVRNWLTGVRDTMLPYRTGVYGQFSVIEMAHQLDPSIFRWQTQAWSDGMVSRYTDILQFGSTTVAGISIDLDIAYTDAFGQWYADPAKQPTPGTESYVINGIIEPMSATSIPVPPQSPTYIMLMCDVGLFMSAAQRVRVALHSKAKGWSQIVDQVISSAEPVTITFDDHDVDAVSLSRTADDGAAPVGYSIV